jgi:ATP synthase protein I
MPLLDPEGRKQLKLASRVSAVGLEMVLAMGLGFLGGRWLDGRFGTSPYLTAIGFALGLFTGFYALYRVARNTNLDRM